MRRGREGKMNSQRKLACHGANDLLRKRCQQRAVHAKCERNACTQQMCTRSKERVQAQEPHQTLDFAEISGLRIAANVLDIIPACYIQLVIHPEVFNRLCRGSKQKFSQHACMRKYASHILQFINERPMSRVSPSLSLSLHTPLAVFGKFPPCRQLKACFSCP